MSTSRPWLRRTLLALTGLLFLVVVLAVLAALPPGEEFLRGVVENQLAAALGQPVTLGRLETNLFSRLQLDSLVVASDTAGHAVVVVVDRIYARYHLWPLLSGTIAVDSLIIDKVSLGLLRDTTGRFNLALLDSIAAPVTDTAAAEQSESSYTLELGDAVIREINVVYDDRLLDLNAFLTGLAATLHESEPGRLQFDIVSDTGRVYYRNQNSGSIDVHARGEYADHAVRLDTLAVQFERLALNAEGTIPADSTTPVSGTLHLTGSLQTLLDLASREFDLPQVSLDDTISLAADLSGTRTKPSARLTLDLPSIRTQGIEVEQTHLGAGWDGRQVTIDSLLLVLFDGTVTGRGLVQTDTTVTSDMHLNLNSIDFAALWGGLYEMKSPYSGTLNGDIELNTVGADWHGWKAELNIGARNARYEDLPLRDLQIRATVDTGSVIASIAQEYFHIEAAVKIDEPNVNGRLSMQIEKLGPLAGLFNFPDVHGALDGHADLSGTIDNPNLTANITGHDITYRNFPVDTIALVASYVDSVLTLSDLTASGYREHLDSAGPMFDIDSLTGKLSYNAKVRGRLDALTGRLDLHLLSPGYRNYRLDSVNVVAVLDSGRVDLQEADLYRDSLFVTARGQLQLEGPQGSIDALAYDLTATKDDSTSQAGTPTEPAPYRLVSNLESVFSLPDTGDFKISVRGAGIDVGALEDMLVDSFDVGGIASFELALRGPMNQLTAEMTLRVQQPRYEDVRLDSLTGAVTLAGDTLNVAALRLFGADQSLIGSVRTVLAHDSLGDYTLVPESPISGQLDVEDLDLRVLEPFLWQDGQLSGYSTLHLNWNGTLSDPNVRGQLVLDSVTVVPGLDVQPITQIYLVSAIADTVFTIDSASGLLRNSSFELHGSATLSGGKSLMTDIAMTIDTVGTIAGRGLLSQDQLDFTATVDSFDLALAQPFVTTVTALGGTLSSTVHLTGSADAPQVDGRLNISNLTAGYEMLEQPLTGGTVKATFTRTRVVLDTAAASIGKGTVTASGYFTYADSTIKDIDIRVRGRNVRIVPMPDFFITVDSATMAYTKPDEYFRLDGDIVLGETRYEVDLEPTAILSWTRRVEQTPLDFPEFVQKTRLGLRVRNSDKIWVDNNLAHIRLHAELETIGNIERPNLSGQLLIAEGYLLYLDRKFTIKDGTFYFSDPNKINPDLNLTATTSVKSYQALESTTYDITFSVTGTMEQPVVALTSDPTLERADIISLLTLGATRQELAGGGSTGQILQERAEALASRQISGYVGSRVGNLLGLDEVSVEGNIFNTTDTTGPELVAAKQISDNLRVTYKTTVGHLNEQSVRVNYDIWRHFSLEGQTNRRGEASLNLKYGIRFR